MHQTFIDSRSGSFNFLLGSLLGDGDIEKYRARFRTRRLEYAKEFLRHCKIVNVKATCKTFKVRSKPYYTIHIYSKLFSFLAKRKIREGNFIDINFMNAFLDAEGTCVTQKIRNYKTKKRIYKIYNNHNISLYNTNTELMEKISDFLLKQKINHSFKIYKLKPYATFFGKRCKRKKRFLSVIRIKNKKGNILKFAETFRFSIKSKQENLLKIRNYYLNQPEKITSCKVCGKRINHYFNAGLCNKCYRTCYQIAKEINIKFHKKILKNTKIIIPRNIIYNLNIPYKNANIRYFRRF